MQRAEQNGRTSPQGGEEAGAGCEYVQVRGSGPLRLFAAGAPVHSSGRRSDIAGPAGEVGESAAADQEVIGAQQKGEPPGSPFSCLRTGAVRQTVRAEPVEAAMNIVRYRCRSAAFDLRAVSVR